MPGTEYNVGELRRFAMYLDNLHGHCVDVPGAQVAEGTGIMEM